MRTNVSVLRSRKYFFRLRLHGRVNPNYTSSSGCSSYIRNLAAFGFLFYIADSFIRYHYLFWLEYFLTWPWLFSIQFLPSLRAARSVIKAPAPRSKLITAPSGQQNLTAEKRSFGRNLDVFFKINMQKGTNNILECKQDCALYAATRQIVFYRSIDRFLKSKFGYDNLQTA